MPTENIELITKLIEVLRDQPDAAVQAAKITVYGMLSVALITGLTQFIASYLLFQSELRKLRHQANTEMHVKQLIQWRESFMENISSLLTLSDPEVYPTPDKIKFIPVVLRTQLLLDESIPEQSKVNQLVNQLALAVNGWQNNELSYILSVHGQLVDASKTALKAHSVQHDL
jgi:hypothetical protein